jgi:RNA polymerase sigma-70 factor, ECF subfamily
METPVSLLERLRKPDEQDAWKRFVHLYTPLLYHWTRRVGVPSNDAADVVQDVFMLLMRKLPEFTYDRHKSFRRWLRTVTFNRWRETQRRAVVPTRGANAEELANVEATDSVADAWDAEYRERLVGRALELMQTDFEAATWKAFWEHRVAGRPAAEVAKELDISVNAVYLATSRVLRRLRQELDGLLN